MIVLSTVTLESSDECYARDFCPIVIHQIQNSRILTVSNPVNNPCVVLVLLIIGSLISPRSRSQGYNFLSNRTLCCWSICNRIRSIQNNTPRVGFGTSAIGPSSSCPRSSQFCNPLSRYTFKTIRPNTSLLLGRPGRWFLRGYSYNSVYKSDATYRNLTDRLNRRFDPMLDRPRRILSFSPRY